MVLCRVAFDDKELEEKLEAMSALIEEVSRLAFSLRGSYGVALVSEEPEADQTSR